MIVRGGKDATQQRRHTKSVEEITVYIETASAAGASAIGHVEARGIPDGHSGKCLLVIPDLLPDWIGEEGGTAARCSGAAFGIGHTDEHKLIWVFHRQAAQGHGVKQLKDGGVGADTEGERENGDGGKCRIQPQDAKSITKVAIQARKHSAETER